MKHRIVPGQAHSARALLRAILWCVLLSPALLAQPSAAQAWTAQVRGSWVRTGQEEPGDVLLAAGAEGCQIVVAPGENSAVHQAARFLAGDIEKLSGYRPPVVEEPTAGRVTIRLVTLGVGELSPSLDVGDLRGEWEAYRIVTRGNTVWLVGSNFRGTAFASYTLSERLGIDPLYLWTGYRPQHHDRLVLKETDFSAGPPTVKYRGMFHDDEDILQRPFEYAGYPLRTGDVPLEWYEKFFETALRLRMNMVAPYTRAHRRHEVQKLASDWGLFYTSHHYDVLLSNPFGILRFNLAEKRGVDPDWDWFGNRQDMIDYWRGGVLENRDVNAIWPVGLRGTDDHGYYFPEGTTDEEKAKVYGEVINTQVQLARSLLPPGSEPVFHLTLYTEMLKMYREHRAEFDVPDDVIIVWPDDNSGHMRGLPTDPGKWQHGVYYHLAYLSGRGTNTKQVTHIVPPARVASEFRKIVDAGATGFMLVNVSELRTFVMEARMIAEICWNAPVALGGPDPAGRYVAWWSREYFGEDAAPGAVESYERYYDLMDTGDKLWFASAVVGHTLDRLRAKLAGRAYDPIDPETVEALRERDARYQAAMKVIEGARAKMNRQQQRFFFEHVKLGLLFDYRATQAALKLIDALEAPDPARTWALVREAREPLEQLEIEILRAEHPPFQGWYRKTWIRRERKFSNVHRPYEELRAFIASDGRDELKEPAGARRLEIADSQRWTRFLESMEAADTASDARTRSP